MKTRTYFIIVISAVTVFSILFAMIFVVSTYSNTHSTVPENDKYCYSELIIKTTKYMGSIFDRNLVGTIVRDEIAKFGAVYDVSNRHVLVTDLGENKLRISLDGSWSLRQDRPNLVQSLTNLSIVENVVEDRGNMIVVGCQ